jgi:hypothetical protein
MFDQGMSLAKQIPVLTQEEVTKFIALARPFVVKLEMLSKSLTGDESALRACLTDFKASLNSAIQHAPATRGSKSICDADGDASIRESLSNLFSAHSLLDTSREDLSSLKVVGLFGIGKGYSKPTSEYCGVAVVRLSVEGARTIVSSWASCSARTCRVGFPKAACCHSSRQ